MKSINHLTLIATILLLSAIGWKTGQECEAAGTSDTDRVSHSISEQTIESEIGRFQLRWDPKSSTFTLITLKKKKSLPDILVLRFQDRNGGSRAVYLKSLMFGKDALYSSEELKSEGDPGEWMSSYATLTF